MRTFSLNRSNIPRDLHAPLTESTEERGNAGKWFAAAISAIIVVLTITIIALFIPETYVLPSCRYYESKNIAVYRDVSRLSAEEKANIITAYKRMRNMSSVYDQTITSWDYFVGIHMLAVRENITTDWRFLPWAREFGIRFRREMARALQISGGGTAKVPFAYWNWTNSTSTAALYKLDFLGGKGNASHGCLVKNGLFTKANNWSLTIHSVMGEEAGLLRCEGNGLQLCQSSLNATSFYLLDTPTNPRSVDSQERVGPFLDLSDNRTHVMMFPDANNLDVKWDNEQGNRFYYEQDSNGSTFNLTCRHYGSRAPMHNDTLACKEISMFASTNPGSHTFATCVIGLDAGDRIGMSAETRGIPVHSLYGSLRAYLGGSMSAITSPNDPIFPHLLANLDRLWVEYQEDYPTKTEAFVDSINLIYLDEDIPGFVGTSFRSVMDTRQKHYTYDTLCTDTETADEDMT